MCYLFKGSYKAKLFRDRQQQLVHSLVQYELRRHTHPVTRANLRKTSSDRQQARLVRS